MDTSTIWWLLAGSLVAIELMTGTFYLLMLSIGLASGAIAAHAALSMSMQLVIAALVASCAMGVWHWLGPRKTKGKTQSNQDLHIDIGSKVEVTAWSDLGAASVLHRGAAWSARHSQAGEGQSQVFQTGTHTIVEVDGNTLVLSQI